MAGEEASQQFHLGPAAPSPVCSLGSWGTPTRLSRGNRETQEGVLCKAGLIFELRRHRTPDVGFGTCIGRVRVHGQESKANLDSSLRAASWEVLHGGTSLSPGHIDLILR